MTITPATRKHAEWFAGLWERFQWSELERFHLRRGHYQVVSVTDVIRSDGRPYLNDDDSGSFLNTAAKYARHLGLVDPTRIVDMKNTEKYLVSVERDYGQDEIGYWVEDTNPWVFSTLELPVWGMPVPVVTGHDYHSGDQPYHLEVWVEKSTMNDILIPICRRLHTNLIVASGYQSITNAVELLVERVKDRPCRVLYISDFDVAGESMPSAIGRQIE